MFRYDSPVFRFMSKIADIIILNFLWILCSLPVFTIGASTTALYYVCMKLVKNEEGYLLKDFFHSFKQNFRQATLALLLYLLIGAFFVADIYLLTHSGQEMTGIASILRIVFFAALAVLFCIAEYTFPLLARFDNTVKNTVKNAFVLGFVNLKSLISITFVNSVVVLLIVLTPNTFMKLIFVCVVVGISGPAYINAYTFNKLFEMYLPKESTEESEGDTAEAEPGAAGDGEPEKTAGEDSKEAAEKAETKKTEAEPEAAGDGEPEKTAGEDSKEAIEKAESEKETEPAESDEAGEAANAKSGEMKEAAENADSEETSEPTEPREKKKGKKKKKKG